ncbi:MAG TPA: N-acetylornithine carbamoyltransferase [Cyclobacteriaceae bacterium]
MKQFLSVDDVKGDPMQLVEEATKIKQHPFKYNQLGKHKTLGLIFLNPSLRTRLSTIRAAQNLGLKTISMNINQDGWQLETESGSVMDQGRSEHIREAAGVIGEYCDIIGIRAFPTLIDREKDYSERLLRNFNRYCKVPLINLESATLHPLQSLADLLTIKEFSKKKDPKIVLSWAPHLKPLPQSVPNSLCEWISKSPYKMTITHPEGMDLKSEFTGSIDIEYDQQKALEGADFVYAKNWSSYINYGAVTRDQSWIINQGKMGLTNNAYFMHCLPVRRNVVVTDDVLDSAQAIVMQQAANRVFTAQAVLKNILQSL